MHHDVLLVIGLLFAVSLLTLLSPKLGIAYPILLVLGGLVIALVPGLPRVHVDPDLIFLIFLPPLLYEAAWFTSWREFWKWRRAISLLAFGLVFFTSIVVGYVSSWFIPGFTVALGFLLGGIISPPDAVAATSVLKDIPIPKRAMAILQGESLVNDASSLVVFQFAVAAVVTGHFSLQEAVGQFAVLALGGVAIGLLLASVVYVLHTRLPTTPSIDAALTLMTPYLIYTIAEDIGTSGVLAVVSGGLFLAYRAHTFLDHNARMQATHAWSTFIFMLNGLVFILIGLELPVIVAGIEGEELLRDVGYGLLVSLLVIVVRFVWMFAAAHIPRWLHRGIRERESDPGWRLPVVLSWAGMRGVVSLAAALAIPDTLPSGPSFPQRSTILVIAFVVILVTLVGQGLTLPWVVRTVKLEETDPHMPVEEQEAMLRGRLSRAVLDHLPTRAESREQTERVREFFARQESRYEHVLQALQGVAGAAPRDDEQRMLREIMQVRRAALTDARGDAVFDDDVIRRVEGDLDLEESRLAL